LHQSLQRAAKCSATHKCTAHMACTCLCCFILSPTTVVQTELSCLPNFVGPGGTCQGGSCKPAIKCPPTCPAHPNACKEFECDLNTGKCSIVVDK
jgi:hypothetical protein